ncbi:MAG: alpha/beta hydrolase, partial [Flavisolibacter sp.]|nr:alpha/beta hydrolase [Flavisolibacter sp.]
MKKITVLAVVSLMILGLAYAQTAQTKKSEKMKQTERPDHYTFQLSDKVTRQKVSYKNRYGITIAADLYLPKNAGNESLAALAITGPFGAVKEQSSGLYAQNMAER